MADCPRCHTGLDSSVHAGVFRCGTCGGHLVTPATVPVLMQQVGVNLGLLADLAKAGREMLACPACPRRQWEFSLKGVTVDACVACGHVWLDGGELGKLTRGRWEDTPPAAPQAALDPGLRALGVHHAPNAMLDAFVADARWFRIKQRVERMELFFGIQTINRYVVDAPNGVGTAQETDAGVLSLLSRVFLRGMRKLEVTVFDAVNNPVISMGRRFYWIPFFGRSTSVEGFDGTPLGTIEEQFTILNNVYRLLDARGRPWATVKRTMLGMGWTFLISDEKGRELGHIKKQWSGMLKESFTTADNFEVTLQDLPLTVPQRAVVLCMALLADFNHFENRQSGGGVMRLLGE